MAKFCAECGSAMTEGDAFCVHCGARTASAAPTLAPAAGPPPAAPPPMAMPVPPVAAAPAAAAPPAAAPASMPVATPVPASRGGVPLGRQIFVALVWGAFAAGGGYLYERTTASAVTYFVAGAVATFALLVALSAVRWVLTAPFRRGAATAGAGIGVGAVVLTLLGGVVVAGTTFVVAPDLPPRLLDPQTISEKVTSLLPLPAPQRKTPPEKLVSLRDPAEQAAARIPPDAAAQRAAAALQQLRAAGIKVSAVGIVETASGQKVMVVGYSAGSLSGQEISDALNALVKLAQANAVDLSGIDAVSVGLHDSQGRVIFSMSATTASIQSFRTGKTTRRQFIHDMALRADSKLGVLDAFRQLAGK